MIFVNENDIDKITETFHRMLKGETPSPIQLPDDCPDNEIRQLTEYVNRFLTEYNKATDLVHNLSKGELGFKAPKGKTLFLHSLKNLQSNLKHLTWKTQQIARGDFTQERKTPSRAHCERGGAVRQGGWSAGGTHHSALHHG